MGEAVDTIPSTLNKCLFVSPDGRTDGRTDRQTDRQINRQTDGQTHTQTDRQTDRRIDKDMGVCMNTNIEVISYK